jgi:hypothetical protein
MKKQSIEEKEVRSFRSGAGHLLDDIYKDIKFSLEIRIPNMRLLKDKSCDEGFKNTFKYVESIIYSSSDEIFEVDNRTDIKKYIFKEKYFKRIYKTSKFEISDGRIRLGQKINSITIHRKDIINKYKDYITDINNIPVIAIYRMCYKDKKCFYIKTFLYLEDEWTLYTQISY